MAGDPRGPVLADADPSWTTDADTRLPRQAQRMLRQLRDRGIPVALPVCSGCGREQLLTQTLEDGRRVCDNCRDARYTRRCDGCNRIRVISHRIHEKSFCGTCRRQRPDAKETCIRCGQDRLVHNRTPDGPVCPQCAPGKIEPCVHCGHERRVRVRFLGGSPANPASTSSAAHDAPARAAARSAWSPPSLTTALSPAPPAPE